MAAVGFIEKQFKTTITWAEWFIAGAPFSAVMSIALYFIVTRMMKPEIAEIVGGRATIRAQFDAIGPTTPKEWKLLATVLTLLGFSATEKLLHDFDTSSTTIAAIALMLLTLFLIVIHLGLASATALASTMIPIVISVLTAVQTSGINVIGMTMLLQFVVSFGLILPVNAPQNMIAYGTDIFDAKDFIRTGLVITLAATLLPVMFSLTYWPWMGYMTQAA